MQTGHSLRPATLLRRLNRFAVAVHVDGTRQSAHLPNSGRLHELLTPGRPTLVAMPGSADRRRTVGDAVFMLGPNSWVSVDARLPGPLLAEAVQSERVEALRGYRVVRREYPVPDEPGSRLDLLLEGPNGPALVETKSVTLVERNGTAVFPDAPTLRGQRHLRVLMRARQAGMEALVVFVVQRPDAVRFSPHWAADPAFSRALVEAARQGVRVLAFSCRVRPPHVEILRPIEVRLSEPA